MSWKRNWESEKLPLVGSCRLYLRSNVLMINASLIQLFNIYYCLFLHIILYFSRNHFRRTLVSKPVICCGTIVEGLTTGWLEWLRLLTMNILVSCLLPCESIVTISSFCILFISFSLPILMRQERDEVSHVKNKRCIYFLVFACLLLVPHIPMSRTRYTVRGWYFIDV